MSESPPDRCPFARPFRPDFSGCQAFEPKSFKQIAGAAYAQVRPIGSCANLQVGRSQSGAFYPKCRAGGAAVFAPNERVFGEGNSEAV